jgi:rhodanese-related sulfurtransferase
MTEAANVDRLLQEARATLPARLSPAEAAGELAADALLIDIRGDDQRRADGDIPGALVIPRNSLEWRCDPTSAWRHPRITGHEQRLILVCNEGFQSSFAAANLQRLGMRRATDVAGGFTAWRAAGLPVTAHDDTGVGAAPPGGDADATHWDAVYARSRSDAVSWYQRSPDVSIELIRRLGITVDSAILDVGGGESALAAGLVAGGHRDVTVLDISPRALDACAQRTGDSAALHLVAADVLTWRPMRTYGLWHDRALLHFMIDPDDRRRYIATLTAAVSPTGAVIIGAFAPDGPEHCSGLPVLRYSAAQLASLLGDAFTIQAERSEEHITPGGATQRFQWAAFTRVAEAPSAIPPTVE